MREFAGVETGPEGAAAFDHHSREWAADWPGVTSELRARCPVARTTAHGGYWMVTGYEEALAIAKDSETFMNGRVDGESSYFIPSTPLQLIPLETDPPLQTQIRRVLNPIFTERMADMWSDFVRQATDALLDEHIESGRVDLQSELSRRVTATVNLALVGLTASVGDIERFISAPGIVARERPESAVYKEAVAATRDMESSLLEIIHDRRRAPRDDVATVVAHMTLDEDPAANEQILLRLIQNLVAGGNSTTTSLIAHALLWLGDHPDQRERLIADPEMLMPAVEEFVRYFSPAHTVGRRARQAAEIAGQSIAPGDRLVICFAAANRDGRVYEEPDEVQLDRGDQSHLAFGYGRHRCLGRSFARMTARVVLGRLLERIPDYRIDVAHMERYPNIAVVDGITALPATFNPGTAVGATMPSVCPPLPDKVKV